MAEKTLGSLIVNLVANASQFTRGIGQAQKQLNKFADDLGSLGGKLTRTVTAPLVGVGAVAGKEAANLETAFGKIEGLVGISRDQLDKWKGDLLAIATETGKTPQELADGLFVITSAGIRTDAALEVLRSSAKASASGLGEITDIARAVGAAINAYGAENLTAADATDILAKTIEQGNLDAATLAAALGSVLPVASQMGVEFQEVGAAIAAMTLTGASASEAVTRLRAVLTTFAKPTERAAKALASMGTSAKEMREAISEEGLLSSLTVLTEKMRENNLETSEVFRNSEALTGTLQLVGKNAESVKGVFEELNKFTGKLSEAFEATDGTGRKFLQTGVALRILFGAIGEDLLPLINDGLDFLKELLVKATVEWKSFSQEQKNTVGIMTLFMGILGPVLTGVATLAGAVLGFVKILGSFGVAISAGAVALKGLIVGGVLAAVTAFAALSNTVENAFNSIFESINRVVPASLGLLGRLIRAVLKAIALTIKLIQVLGLLGAGEFGRAAAGVADIGAEVAGFAGVDPTLPGGISLEEARGRLAAGVLGPLQGLASGGRVLRAGLAMVGERGPEVLSMPRGAAVAPLGGSGGMMQTIVVQLDGRELARGVLKGMPTEARIATGRA